MSLFFFYHQHHPKFEIYVARERNWQVGDTSGLRYGGRLVVEHRHIDGVFASGSSVEHRVCGQHY